MATIRNISVKILKDTLDRKGMPLEVELEYGGIKHVIPQEKIETVLGLYLYYERMEMTPQQFIDLVREKDIVIETKTEKKEEEKPVKKEETTSTTETKETETKYDGSENPEPVVKVELNKKKLANTQVKYVYSIKVTNEGQIEGYAKELTDRIPAGLAFYEEDNKEYNWKIGENGMVTTDYLANKLLKPGESAIVQIVLRWENSGSNLGQKVNVAEITKDENPYGVPDLDSTPNNNKDGEDDQDQAIVVLSLTTGSAPMYIALTTIIVAILGAGFYLIYKHVVKNK